MLASYGFSAAVAMAAGTKSVAIVTQNTYIHTVSFYICSNLYTIM